MGARIQLAGFTVQHQHWQQQHVIIGPLIVNRYAAATGASLTVTDGTRQYYYYKKVEIFSVTSVLINYP